MEKINFTIQIEMTDKIDKIVGLMIITFPGNYNQVIHDIKKLQNEYDPISEEYRYYEKWKKRLFQIHNNINGRNWDQAIKQSQRKLGINTV